MKKYTKEDVINGYARLAFGSHSGALKILSGGGYTPGGADTYCVQKIKVQGNLTEIQFYDRLEALEKLQDLLEDGNGEKKLSGIMSILGDMAEESRKNMEEENE